jgi:hypothetical protein
MKKPLLFLVLLAVVFNSCQKELSVETSKIPSVGSLQSDVSGDCLPKNVVGIYEAGKVINGTNNYIEVQVSVTSTGAYTIFTDTINNVYFRAVGIFTQTGLNTIKLKGNGTPQSAGVNIYLVQYDTTECSVAVETLPAGGANPAVMTLAGSPNACMVSNTAGNYVAGVPLDITNTVTIGVNVTTMGTYNISTPVSNGIIFSGNAVVQAGATTITLTGSGTPAAAGSTNVVVTIGASTCTFTVTVTGTTPVTNTDYFPLTANSWWSYDDPDGLFVLGDSLTRVNAGALTYNGNSQSYRVFQNQNETTTQDSSYYRKAGNDYFELTPADWYCGAVQFTTTIVADLNFLKQNLTTGATWESPVYSGTEQTLNAPLKLKYVYNCTDANATVTVNGKSYSNVYKVSWKPQIMVSPSTTYTNEAIVMETWYAKGIGIVYWKVTDIPGTTSYFELSLRNFKVF